MESSKRDQGSAFVYQRLGWEIRDGGPEADDPPVIVPIGGPERSEPPLVLAAIAMRAALAAEDEENASLKAQVLK